MKVMIKKGVHRLKIYGEDDFLEGFIEGSLPNTAVRQISDHEGNPVYKIIRENAGYRIEWKGAFCEVAVQYEEEEGLLRLPMAESAVVRLPSVRVELKQNRKRNISLCVKGNAIGRVCGISGVEAAYVECQGKWNPLDLALLYVLAVYMYHNDDLDVV